MRAVPVTNPKPWYFEILACPDCLGGLVEKESVLICNNCTFSSSPLHQLDLRPQSPRRINLEVPRIFYPTRALANVEISRPAPSFNGPTGIRNAAELLSVMQDVMNEPGRVLDLGCGPRDQAEPIGFLGHDYVGIDLSSAEADILCDAHALPFRSASLDFVFSYAVLSHLHNPFLAISEVKRVLKAGGTYCGTVGQGEPFNNTFFHHTVWGMLSLAHALDLTVLRLWSCWDTLSGLASMGRYPRVIRYAIGALDRIHSALPALAPRKMAWSRQDKLLDGLHRAASIGFVIRK